MGSRISGRNFRCSAELSRNLQLLPQEQAPWKEKKGNKRKGVLSFILYRNNACFSLRIHLISSLAMATVQKASKSIHWDEHFTVSLHWTVYSETTTCT